MDSSPAKRARTRETRVLRCFMNGCYDLLHFGHLNALRQVKQYQFDISSELTELLDDKVGAPKTMPGSDGIAAVKEELGHPDVSCFRSSIGGELRYFSPAFFLDLLQSQDSVAEWHKYDIKLHVVAGIHSNDEIRRVKGGAFINSEEEKERLLLACKFVDEVVHDVPYGVIYPEKYGCDLVFHGDDEIMLPLDVVRKQRDLGPWEKEKMSTDPELIDMYGYCKATGKFKYIRRTEGISTTLMVKRLFHSTSRQVSASPSVRSLENVKRDIDNTAELPEYVNPTANRFYLFFTPRSKAGKKVVYLQGYWDLFHIGHLDVLEAVRTESLKWLKNQNQTVNTESIYLVVGVLPSSSDKYQCIQSLHERAMSLLSLRIVDDVVLEVQNRVDERFRRSLGIDVVAHVRGHPDFADEHDEGLARGADVTLDCRKDASDHPLFTRQTILDRFEASRDAFVKRQSAKSEPELRKVEEKGLLSS
eukprot:TRINITY_DN22481_c0_g1_i1.p1 TRINITY_DN22481_c0_g1~~TRINITY_DN22481_c0_g1_i1.p1  ORF type:complete len:475 (-),score=61.64 TRINITY_DN22481_c0_g1_i1:80-1504(-)